MARDGRDRQKDIEEREPGRSGSFAAPFFRSSDHGKELLSSAVILPPEAGLFTDYPPYRVSFLPDRAAVRTEARGSENIHN